MNYYRVNDKLLIPQSESHHDYGYEDYNDFFTAMRERCRKYAGLTGLELRHSERLVMLRLYDEDGDLTRREAWFPRFMLSPTPPPVATVHEHAEDDEVERELDKIFGFF